MVYSPALARHRYLLQVCFVAVTITACVLASDAIAFRAPANLVWMAGIPVVVGMIANIDWERRCFMTMVLVAVSLIVEMVVGVFFTSYG